MDRTPLTVIRCERCGATLALKAAGCIIVKHHGLEAVAIGIVSLKCPDCKRVWEPADRSATPEMLKAAS